MEHRLSDQEPMMLTHAVLVEGVDQLWNLDTCSTLREFGHFFRSQLVFQQGF
jgi:hypothetical protein